MSRPSPRSSRTGLPTPVHVSTSCLTRRRSHSKRGFDPGSAWAGFWEGVTDDEDATVYSILYTWILAIFVAMLLVRPQEPH